MHLKIFLSDTINNFGEKNDGESSTTVENLTWNERKSKFMKNINNYEETPQDCFLNSKHRYLRSTKKILLMFRRNIDKKALELRHQRNPDAFFDIVNPENPDQLEETTMNKIYETIETLLPQTIDCVK